MRSIRAHFDENGYMEVDTPHLAPDLIPEPYIRPFATEFSHPEAKPIRLGLLPSPERWIKRLLASGFGNIYQLGHVFRNGENLSPIHNPEFSMLEWYTVEAGYLDSITHTARLLSRIHDDLGDLIDERRRWIGSSEIEITSVEDEFARAGLGRDLFREERGMRKAALQCGLRVGDGESEEQLFQRVFLTCIEPTLPKDRPVVVIDYPALVPTLAATREDGVFAERWELYLAGMEIANCYSEERDASAIERYVEQSTPAWREGSALNPVSDLSEFSDAPPCSGVALGVDRLLAVLTGRESLEGVIFFPGFSIFR
jgi:lysyl-tRNA synthetase class 2